MTVPASLDGARADVAVAELLNITRSAAQKLLDAGMVPAGHDAKPLAQVISEDIRTHAELIKAAGITPQ